MRVSQPTPLFYSIILIIFHFQFSVLRSSEISYATENETEETASEGGAMTGDTLQQPSFTNDLPSTKKKQASKQKPKEEN
jgi:hypothetical protein